MNVKKLMTKDVGVCKSGEFLTAAAEVMRAKDCGFVPVVDDKDQLIGVITDRDICLAVAEFEKKPSEILISEVMGKKVKSCSSKDKIETALKLMKRKKIKRLPVVNSKKQIVGILSIADFLTSKKIDKAMRGKVYSTLRAIVKPRVFEELKPIVLNEVVEQ